MNTTYQNNGAKVSFWTVLAEQVVELGWSMERVKFATNYMLRNCPYKEFRVSEFLNIDKQVHIISREEFARIEESRQPNEPIVSVKIDGKAVYMYQADADKVGITDYKRMYTTWEALRMTRAERIAAGIFWI